MKIGKKLATLRIERNLSQEKVAEVVGVTRQSVAKWESGESLPEVEKLLGLSDYFGVSIDAMVREDGSCRTSSPSPQFAPETSIVSFLCRAKAATYAGHGNEGPSSRLGSHDLEYEEGALRYYDSYLGSECFSGEEAVWERGKPIWAMNYSGRVLGPGFSGDFLKEALLQGEEVRPYRGPQLFRKGDLTYHCSVEGGFDWFQGREDIYYGSTRVYECLFHGGKVV